MSHFRESAAYREYYESHDSRPAKYSDCCQGEPIGECRKCGQSVCEDHGVLDAEEDAWCTEHAPATEEDYIADAARVTVTLSPVQVWMLAEVCNVA